MQYSASKQAVARMGGRFTYSRCTVAEKLSVI